MGDVEGAVVFSGDGIGRVKGRFGCSEAWVWWNGTELKLIAELVVCRRLFDVVSLMVCWGWTAWVWVKVRESWFVRR